jgi:hypothetical protein
MNTERFDIWCMVELFGHSKIAGRCTEQNIAGTNMLRVDVPETSKQPAFTRFFGSGAIYAINPIDEETARFYANKLEISPIQSYNISELVQKHNALMLEKSAASVHSQEKVEEAEEFLDPLVDEKVDKIEDESDLDLADLPW